MKKLLVLLAFFSLLFSCGNHSEQHLSKDGADLLKQNDLLPQAVIAYSEVNFKTHPFPEWVSGVDSVYMTELNGKVIDSEVELFSSNIYYEPSLKVKMTDEDIRANLVPEGEINALYFIEEWSFNKEDYAFDKKIITWSPVLEFYKRVNGTLDTSKKAKRLLYDLWGTHQGNEKKIAENITYEVDFMLDRTTNEFLDIEKLTKLIVAPVLSGEQKAFEFFDNTEMSIVEIKEEFGWSVDSIEFIDPITGDYTFEVAETEAVFSNVSSFVFTEDWFLDQDNYAIRKEIKSIAPVNLETSIDEDGEVYEVKKIVFKVNL